MPFAGKKIDHIGVKIEPGFSLKGLIDILGFKLRCKIVVNFKKEIMLDVAFSPIKIANGLLTLQRSGKDEENGPVLVAKITPEKVRVKIAGYVYLLGISAGVNIDVNDDYMKFAVHGNLFNLFETNITVQAGYKKLEEASFMVCRFVCLCLVDESKVKVPSAPMAHRAAPISVSSSPKPHICERSGGLVHW